MNQSREESVVAYAPPERIECLDSIRGLAALAVLLGHTVEAFAWPPGLVNWTHLPFINILFDGRSAVTMFFVLSGFVLTHPYLAPPTDGQPPRRLFLLTFYVRRVIRIWFPWFFVFVLSILAKTFLLGEHPTSPPATEWRADFWHGTLSLSSFLRQCTFTLHDSRQLLLPQDWSLGVELKGSALVPLFLLLVRRNIPVLILVSALFLIFVPTGAYYVSFVLGVGAARCYHQWKSPLHSLARPWKFGMLALGLILYESRLASGYVWDIRGVDVVDKVVWCITSIGCLLILAASLSSSRLRSKLNLPVSVFLGKISYSVYLLQFIVIVCFLPPLVQMLNIWGLRQPSLLLPITVVVGVLATVLIATGMYRAIELPSIQFGRWLTKLIQKKLKQSHA